MPQYKVKSNCKRNFSLIQNEKILGNLTYQGWFSLKSDILLADNSKYQIVYQEDFFLRTKMILKDNENILLNFKMNWNLNIMINTKFENIENHYIFKNIGVLSSIYSLLDSKERELLVIQPEFEWRKLNYSYNIKTSTTFDKFENKDILLLSTIHCINYYIDLTSA
ncbi:MAG: hypothetical protein EAZ08_04890 [Cytophagales bacterium]|nr:MAG: hypothetical protein EAZ08_04890 [Cytophagales bacterium]